MSGQREWQKRKVAAGLCPRCGQPAGLGHLCESCRGKSRAESRKRKGHSPKKPGGRGRPTVEEAAAKWLDAIGSL